ncbi:MAG: hypothetical protein F6K19_46790 [Cyanothece sp. SIO1E1]|nr:hypothetical protein [Cyanothece sp. SIO1E1]
MPKRRPLTPEEREETTRLREKMNEWASEDESGASEKIRETHNCLVSASAHVEDAWGAVDEGDEIGQRESTHFADRCLDKAEEKLREARDIVESERSEKS